MPKSHRPYPGEFCQQVVELVRAGRTPGELGREFACSRLSVDLNLEARAPWGEAPALPLAALQAQGGKFAKPSAPLGRDLVA